MPRCQGVGCKSDAKRGSTLSKARLLQQQQQQQQLQQQAADVHLLQDGPNGPLQQLQQPQLQQVPGDQMQLSFQPVPFQRQVVVVENPSTVELLRQLQDENKRLLDENFQVQQLQADRLRFEEASQHAWEKVDELERVNRELRAENEQLKIRLAGVEARLSALEDDKTLLEVEQLLMVFEEKVVDALADDPDKYHVSQLDLSDEIVEAKWRAACPTRDISVLKRLQAALEKTSRPRNSVVIHPSLPHVNAQEWVERLQQLLTQNKVHDIENLVQTAMEWVGEKLY